MKYLVSAILISMVSLTAISQDNAKLVFTINTNDTVQRIRNIGASGCWYSEEIGKDWPDAQKQRIAELLFTRQSDKNGQPKGIGLSAFRFNIGAGTAEQGDSSGIRDPSHRVECFLSPNGDYNWDKQQGYRWMLRQAKNYGVSDLIAFVNSPPVQFTKDGLGFKLAKDGSTNLREDKYDTYGSFLANVIKHFDAAGLHFNYISPVNEPQWDWTGAMGSAKQEGSPWTNEEIYKAVKAVSNGLRDEKLHTKILITEAGMLNYLYGANTKSSRQIAAFWDAQSPLYIGGLSNTTPYVEGHGYFTDNGNSRMIGIRKSLRDTLKEYNGLEYWQSEYCMLGDGYRENKAGPLHPIDYALFLAKIIHYDLTIGNASAWHYWNAYEPGSAENPRYYLIALNRNRKTDHDSMYTVTKNLWALGHYSLFVRPGMYRVETERNDGLTDTAIARQVMIDAFRDSKGNRLVVNMINYTIETKNATIVLKDLAKGKNMKLVHRYITSAMEGDDLKPYPINSKSNRKRRAGNASIDIALPARSISSFIFSSE